MEYSEPLKIIDVDDPKQLSKGPEKTLTLLKNDLKFREFVIKKIELRSYLMQKNNKSISLITTFVDTDRGSVEITYDKDSRYDSLESAGKFLLEQLGLSSLILRCILALESELSKD